MIIKINCIVSISKLKFKRFIKFEKKTIIKRNNKGFGFVVCCEIFLKLK